MSITKMYKKNKKKHTKVERSQLVEERLLDGRLKLVSVVAGPTAKKIKSKIKKITKKITHTHP